MSIFIATPGEDDGRRRGKLEVESDPEALSPPSSPRPRIITSDKRSRAILAYSIVPNNTLTRLSHTYLLRLPHIPITLQSPNTCV